MKTLHRGVELQIDRERSNRVRPCTNTRRINTDTASVNAFSRNRKSVGWIFATTKFTVTSSKSMLSHKKNKTEQQLKPTNAPIHDQRHTTLLNVLSGGFQVPLRRKSSNTVNVNNMILNFCLSATMLWYLEWVVYLCVPLDISWNHLDSHVDFLCKHTDLTV